MFKTAIAGTALTSSEASIVFANIGGEPVGFNGLSDNSFVSTLRALVAPRIPKAESIWVWLTRSSYRPPSEKNEVTIRNLVYLDTSAESAGCFRIHSFEGTNEANQSWLDLIDDKFEKAYPGFHRIEKVTTFFRKALRVSCFVNPEFKQVMLFTDKMDLRTFHYIQCGIFAYLPWYFDPEKGVSEEEMALINSLREKTQDKYLECINVIANKYNFREMKIKRLLQGFELSLERAEAESTRSNIRSFSNDIDTLNSRIADRLRSIRDLEIKLLGLEMKIASGGEDSEIMDYFMCNNKLVLESTDGGTGLIFSVRDYLTYYDEDQAKTMIENRRSYIYRPRGSNYSDIIPENDMEMLMRAIFIDQTLKVRFCAAYSLTLLGNGRALSDHYYDPAEFNGYMPNPHIDSYNCLGNHQAAINNLLRDHNYISAIEQCVSSAKSLNFSDSTVMCEFVERLYGRSARRNTNNPVCIELPDGKVVNAKDAIAYLREENHIYG